MAPCMSVPPAPPTSGDAPSTDPEGARAAPAPLQAGQLTPSWRMVFLTGWAAVVAALGSVWYSCRIAGIAPWWLGPETNQRFLLVIIVPFVPPAITIIAAATGSRFACHIG